MFSKTNLGGEESEQSLPSWISDHLGAKSYIDETSQSPSFLPTNPPKMDTSSLTKEGNAMSQAELDKLGSTYSFPFGIRLRIPGDGKTILSARQGEVAFYEAAFLAGLRLPLHPTIREILIHYKICPAQLSPNAWRSVICSLVVWHHFKRHMSCDEFRCLYSLSPLLIRVVLLQARPEKNLFRGSPSNGRAATNCRLCPRLMPRGRRRSSEDRARRLLRALSTSGGENATSGDEGEFVTREDSVEYLGVIRRDIGGPVYKSPIWDVRLQFGFRVGFHFGFRAAPELRSDGAINAKGRAGGAGTSSPGGDMGSESMSDASVARRLLTGVISASDKKEVVVFASSLALRSQEHLHDMDFHMARADSAELELVKAQNRAVKAENRLAELSEEGSKPGSEMDDLKATVAELTNKLAKAKELAIEDFKASENSRQRHLCRRRRRKAKQFMRGLRPSIRNKIAGNLIKVYSTMVSAAVAIEETLNETRKITNSKSQREGTSNQSEGHSFKKPKSSTTQQQYPVRPSPNMSVVSSDQTSRRGPTCFGCHQYGHRVLDCPLKGQLRQSQSRAQSYSQTQDQTQVQASRATPTFTSAQTSYQSRPQAIAQQGQRTQGRVYAMTSAAGSSGATGQQEQQLDTSVVRGTFLMFN
ncbi:hypothetical protein Acr_00g0068400 [Actinidia rufa]|uniref:CCHC-type domain-containing protein n=1 Tax=Actinidia rufa TaxID=165716 RepID=A0A7J0DQP1_9ERIC|nr:hypothetical protein Acr_00g0068400 [Actinidia rufa]